MRIIAGTFRSRQLKSLKNMAMRPTSDKLRETLFNVLGAMVVDARFVDLFAGTGAVGIEALSRGAREAIFVEKHPPAAALIKKNLESLDIHKGARVLKSDALQALKQIAAKPTAASASMDILFLDPPYAEKEQYASVLSFLGGANLLVENAVVIAEHQHSLDLPETFGKLERVRVLRQGDAALTFFRFRPPSPPETPRSE
ncbi:MAG TPA: 16S rRNA (guanine(966)-N(2))-methyltransferase RsmD [Candidatus Sulfotelmatobacter sp.]|jgi:16S rRNA (guanine966-N2)-methyltransferase|nr:16S rRNA (guanine(966)-N(2))-methyltransferase RsmD [Candidatus Sulfotelmatobacter sp.]